MSDVVFHVALDFPIRPDPLYFVAISLCSFHVSKSSLFNGLFYFIPTIELVKIVIRLSDNVLQEDTFSRYF